MSLRRSAVVPIPLPPPHLLTFAHAATLLQPVDVVTKSSGQLVLQWRSRHDGEW